jgi:hypothetical protein
MYFEHDQVKPFIKGQAVKLKGTIDKKVVPAVLKATCKVLEVVANNTADAHDYLTGWDSGGQFDGHLRLNGGFFPSCPVDSWAGATRR